MKISIIGAGNVGSTAALKIAQKNLGDVVLVDIVEGLPQGKALDIQHSMPLWKSSSKVIGTNDFSMIADSNIVIITAGVPRKPGMSREDLIKTNEKITKSICAEIKRYAPGSIVIVVTNPLDTITYLTLKETGFSKQRIMGMAGVLDTARFKTFISEKTGTDFNDIDAIVLGGHSELMIPLVNHTTVSGRPLKEILSEEVIEEIITRTRGAGKEIVEKSGSAYYAPGASIAEMVEVIVKDTGKILPASVHLEGEYGQSNVCMGVPISLGRDGIKSIIELNLTEQEKTALNKSSETIKDSISRLEL